MARTALGIDWGTESVRALAVECETGREIAEAVRPYPHGVIARTLPGSEAPLPPEFALQVPGDWEGAGAEAVARVLRTVSARDVVGVGVDFTACTMLPVLADGTPLVDLEPFRGNPHAFAKLWKHHAAQPEADRVNEAARERGEAFLAYYGGVVSSEWMLPKCWEIARRAPEVYAAADLLVDAGDWIVQRMTGRFCRNACAAGYKGLWVAELGFPSEAFLAALGPEIANVRSKWLTEVTPPGTCAGVVTEAFAARSGLRPGTPVSAATIDAHSGVAGMGVASPGPMSIIMGTSSCHMVLAEELRLFEGFAGVAKDGILPGYWGYESGQSAVGDIFAWFAKTFLGREQDPFAAISARAAALRPGASGIVALDWMNGNRSVLMNARLSGALVGLTLDSRPEEVYRALVEATAFGTRRILDSYREAGLPIQELRVCGGLTRDPLLLQTYADVTGLEVHVAASSQSVALGAAILGALAAGRARGGFDEIAEAIGRMTRPAAATFRPEPDARRVYDRLYEVYLECHDHFGRRVPQVMAALKDLRDLARGEARG